MPIVEGVLEALTSLESDVVAVHPERCILIRNRNAHCLRCAERCAAGAISYDGDALSIDAELCIGCGTCATACPTSAIEALHPADEELHGHAAAVLAAGGGELVVACARAMGSERERVAASCGQGKRGSLGARAETPFDPSRICQVVCLGRLDESFYVEAAARGAQKILLVSKDCDSCKYRNGGCLAVDVCESAQELVESRGCSLDVEFASELPEWSYRPDSPLRFDAEGSTRREFLLSARDTAKHVAASAIAEQGKQGEAELPCKVGEDGVLPGFTPEKRTRLFNSLRALGPSCRERVRTRVWGQVSIDVEACSSCRMCAVFCPTGALSRFESESGAVGIAHRSALCVQCRLCEAICPKEALIVSDEVSLVDFERGHLERIELNPPSWIPNKPDSIFNKVNGMFGGGKNNSYF